MTSEFLNALEAAAAKGTLAEALVAFHKDAPRIVKDAENPHFKNKFASLDSIMSAVRPKLAEHGLAISQHPSLWVDDASQPHATLRTILLHSSGEQLQSDMLLAADKPGPQAQGSALTYARRYAVLAVLGLVADEDDDGNAAAPSPGHSVKVKDAAPAPSLSPPAGAATSNGSVSEQLQSVCDALGVDPQKTRELIANHWADEEWLRRQLVTAEANLAAMKESDASPFKAPVKK